MQKLLMIMLVLVFLACSGQSEQRNNGKLSVLVSVVPQKYFVNRIAGELVDVTVLIPPGASPATYEISPSDMRTVNSADIWFTIGVQKEEEWSQDFPSINENLAIESTINNINRLSITRYGIPGEIELHSDHSHESDDPHVWLSPELVKLQAEEICRILSDADPINRDVYSTNLAVFLREIEEIQDSAHQTFDRVAGKSFIVFHPAWGYFADEFNLNQVPIEIAGNEPTPSEMVELINYARGNSIDVIFVSPQFSDVAANTIAEELGASLIVIDPLALDWIENMKTVTDSFNRALQ